MDPQYLLLIVPMNTEAESAAFLNAQYEAGYRFVQFWRGTGGFTANYALFEKFEPAE